MKYIKELDSLRAIAVLLVIICHWTPYGSIANKLFDGDMGVNIFFVLSGFLITWILLANRKRAADAGQSELPILGNFYVRRVLRIFPIYYLCVLYFYFFPYDLVDNVGKIFPWLFTYTSNIYFFIYQKWDGHVSHVWSLAVEEQFYLLWPGLMLFVNKKYLVHTIGGFILIGAACQFFFRQVPMINYFTVSCFSSFGIGALLAWIMVYRPELLRRFYRGLRLPALISFAVFLFGVFQSRWTVLPMQRIFHSVIAVFLITYIMYKRENGGLNFKFIWNSRILVFIGKISYGIYLYHGFVPVVVSDAMKKYFDIDPGTDFSPVLFFIFKFIVVIATAWVSWVLVEKPILELKKYFGYDNNARKIKAVA